MRLLDVFAAFDRVAARDDCILERDYLWIFLVKDEQNLGRRQIEFLEKNLFRVGFTCQLSTLELYLHIQGVRSSCSEYLKERKVPKVSSVFLVVCSLSLFVFIFVGIFSFLFCLVCSSLVSLALHRLTFSGLF